MVATSVNLRRLRCGNAACPDPHRLVPDAEPGWVRCPSCGFREGAGGPFKPYAARTATWIIGAAVALTVGWRTPGASRWLLVAAGATELAIVLFRLAYQARTLRALRTPSKEPR